MTTRFANPSDRCFSLIRPAGRAPRYRAGYSQRENRRLIALLFD